MDIYTDTLTLLTPLTMKWSEMLDILRHFVARRPRDWELPALACEAVGGTEEQALPAVAAMASLQISIILIDDLLDDELNGDLKQLGEARIANLAAAFQSLGALAIMPSNVQATIKLAILESIHQMFLTTALGQHKDSQDSQDLADEAHYWQIVQNKSAPFYGTLLHVGALLGGASFDLANQLRQLGCLYGEIIQIHDDLSDSLAVPANSDWTLGRSPLPILFAEVVDHPERTRFRELRRSISDPNALTEAQEILLRSGAISYCVDQLLRRYQKACDQLASIRLLQRSKLEALLTEQIEPVWSLFQSMDLPLPPTPDSRLPRPYTSDTA